MLSITRMQGFQRCVAVSGIVIPLLLLCTITSFAQSLGDIARQERERKRTQPSRETHVYTNEDLERPQILVPEDQARALAARRNVATPELQGSQAAVPIAPTAKKSLVVSPVAVAVRTKSLPRIPVRHPQPNSRTGQACRQAPPSSPVERTVPLKMANAGMSLPGLETQKQVSPRVGQHRANPNATERVQIAPGDSLWRLAEWYMGTGGRWHELAELNPEISNPNLLHVGAWIHVPSEASRHAKRIIVRPGDTLWSVAGAELGNSFAYPCIAAANPQLQSPDRILAGEELVLPQTCSLAR